MVLDRLLHNGTWLDQQHFEPLEYAVPGIVPEGMGLLVGPPKKGKSWLVADIGLAVARGGLALGVISTTQRLVLYLALEDGHRRLQTRFRRILGFAQPIPAGIEVITKATPGEALVVIAAFIERHATEKPLVILDTLGKVKRHKRPNEDSYLVDYEVGSQLKALADAVPGSTLLVVHHTRKAEAADFVDTVSGTQGIAGSVDFVLVLVRKRHENNATLSVTGRDIVEAEYALHADDGVLWRFDGEDLDSARENVQQRRAEASMGDRSMDVYLTVAAAAGPVTAHDVASQFEGMDNEAAGQCLRRLHASGYIHKISRGVFSLYPPSANTDEEQEAPPTGSSDSFTSVSEPEAVKETDITADQGRNADFFTSFTSFTPSESTAEDPAQNIVNEVTEVNETGRSSRSEGEDDSVTVSDGVNEVNEQEHILLRVKGVIMRRLAKVGHATRGQLKQALQAKDRPEFDAAFGLLVEQGCLVTDEGNAALSPGARPDDARRRRR